MQVNQKAGLTERSYNLSHKYDSYLKNLKEPYKSSLIFLEDEKKLNFLLTRLAMVLNDSSTMTEKSRTDLLVDYLDREGGPFKNHLFIGLGRVTDTFEKYEKTS